MSTNVTRFELVLPQYGDGTPQNAAVQQFLVNLYSLAPYFSYNATQTGANNTDTQAVIVYGALTPAQAPTALGYLQTLNTALGITVPCISWQVSTQP